MKRAVKGAIYGYVAFAAANYALAYLNRNKPPGESATADFNKSLLRFNVLAYVMPIPVGTVSSTQTVPTGATITVQPAGAYLGP